MEGVDILPYKDGNQKHDHTFLGNGCPNAWTNTPPTYGGSSTSCTTNIIKDGDNNDQLIGALYTFQAATSGSGGALLTDNTDASDSFCPLGWQLPYSGTGGDYYDKSKSWKYLFDSYGILHDDGNSTSVQKVKSYPLSYINSGHLNLTNGYLYNQTLTGLYFSSTNHGDYDADRLVILGGAVRTSEVSNKSYALAVRCFIDGTVAGNPADLTIFIDNNETHDHTYYGRGCSNYWGTGGLGGSATPCTDSDAGGRFVETADGETQKNGTYFNFQAATVGAGGAMDTDKTDSSYTFCPLGWQLPYSGTGGDYDDKSRSWKLLFQYYGYTNGVAGSTGISSYPISYILSGSYYNFIGRLFNGGTGGLFWSSTGAGGGRAYRLNFNTTFNTVNNSDGKAISQAVRCVSELAT